MQLLKIVLLLTLPATVKAMDTPVPFILYQDQGRIQLVTGQLAPQRLPAPNNPTTRPYEQAFTLTFSRYFDWERAGGTSSCQIWTHEKSLSMHWVLDIPKYAIYYSLKQDLQGTGFTLNVYKTLDKTNWARHYDNYQAVIDDPELGWLTTGLMVRLKQNPDMPDINAIRNVMFSPVKPQPDKATIATMDILVKLLDHPNWKIRQQAEHDLKPFSQFLPAYIQDKKFNAEQHTHLAIVMQSCIVSGDIDALIRLQVIALKKE